MLDDRSHRHYACTFHGKSSLSIEISTLRNVFAHLLRMTRPPHKTHAPMSKAMATTIKIDNPVNSDKHHFTGPPNGPVLFCSLASVVVCRLSSSITLPAGRRAGRRARCRSVGRPTLHGGTVVLRPIRATPCSYLRL